MPFDMWTSGFSLDSPSTSSHRLDARWRMATHGGLDVRARWREYPAKEKSALQPAQRIMEGAQGGNW